MLDTVKSFGIYAAIVALRRQILTDTAKALTM